MLTVSNTTAMIRVRIKIGSGNIVDTYTQYGLVYLSSDNLLAAPLKALESTAYPEKEGKNISPKTVDNSFTYKVVFLVDGSTVTSGQTVLDYINSKIKAFNDTLFTQTSGSDIKTLKQVEFYNDYKHIKIVGYAKPISEAKELWRDKNGNQSNSAKVELTIEVATPSLCNFNLAIQ